MNEEKIIRKKQHYQTGELKASGVYRGSLKIGKHVRYYKSGEIARTEFFSNGNRYGKYRRYSKSGEMFEYQEWKNGLKNGLCKVFHPETGKPSEIVRFVKGSRLGESLSFHENGNIKKVRFFYYKKKAKNAPTLLHGQAYTYHPDGDLMSQKFHYERAVYHLPFLPEKPKPLPYKSDRNRFVTLEV